MIEFSKKTTLILVNIKCSTDKELQARTLLLSPMRVIFDALN